MKIEILPFEITEENMKRVADWQNDPTINYLFTPNFQEEELEPIRWDQMQANYLRREKEGRNLYMVLLDGTIVGEGSFEMDSSNCFRHEPRTAWVSLVLGEKRARGLGIGEALMLFLEKKAREQGAKRMELGVFSFNYRALALYRKLNYHFLVRIEDFTWHDGSWHDDIRLEKILEP